MIASEQSRLSVVDEFHMHESSDYELPLTMSLIATASFTAVIQILLLTLDLVAVISGQKDWAAYVLDATELLLAVASVAWLALSSEAKWWHSMPVAAYSCMIICYFMHKGSHSVLVLMFIFFCGIQLLLSAVYIVFICCCHEPDETMEFSSEMELSSTAPVSIEMQEQKPTPK